jgi:hypothetical protein
VEDSLESLAKIQIENSVDDWVERAVGKAQISMISAPLKVKKAMTLRQLLLAKSPY